MKPLAVGLLGCGHIAPTHVRAWRRDPRFELRGVFDLDTEAADKLKNHWPGIEVFRSTEELIQESDVVDICTPPSSHFSLLEQAMAADRHLVVEKPLVIQETEWQELARRLEGYDKSLSVVHHMKFSRCVRTAKQWLDEGRIGRLLRFESYFATHPNLDRMLGGTPHWSHDLPGGRWFETLPHNLYLMHYLAGPLALDSVSAVSTAKPPRGVQADEVSVSMVGPECLGTIHFSANCRHNYRWTTLTGTRGIVRMDLLSGALALDRVSDNRASRLMGRVFLHGLASLARSPLDRARYLLDRLAGRTPHAEFVRCLGAHLCDGADPPTPRDEITYTVENCYEVGKAIEARLLEA